MGRSTGPAGQSTATHSPRKLLGIDWGRIGALRAPPRSFGPFGGTAPDTPGMPVGGEGGHRASVDGKGGDTKPDVGQEVNTKRNDRREKKSCLVLVKHMPIITGRRLSETGEGGARWRAALSQHTARAAHIVHVSDT